MKKALVIIVAIQIINLSIDAVDFQPMEPDNSMGDFNYFNSMVEYLTESVLGYTDAFPEYQKESTSSKDQIVKHLSFKFSQTDYSSLLIKSISLTIKGNIIFDEDPYSLYYSEIIPPPPKA